MKNDSVHRLASIVHTDGREGVEAAWEKTPEFHEAWKAKARRHLLWLLPDSAAGLPVHMSPAVAPFLHSRSSLVGCWGSVGP